MNCCLWIIIDSYPCLFVKQQILWRVCIVGEAVFINAIFVIEWIRDIEQDRIVLLLRK